jgi:Flp pilus assembly protein TadG
MPRRPKHASRRGTTAVECALCLPLLLLLLFGGIEFGRALQVRHTLENAAYEAARVALVPGGTAGEARAEANRVLGTIGVTGATIDVTPATITTATTEVTVAISVSTSAVGYSAPLVLSDRTLRQSCTLHPERNAIP